MKRQIAAIGHMRALTPAELAQYPPGRAPISPALAWLPSPLGVWLEVGAASPEAVLCNAMPVLRPMALAPRLELRAEAFFRANQPHPFAVIVLGSPVVAAHIAALQGGYRPALLAAAQHYARVLLARRAAREALGLGCEK